MKHAAEEVEFNPEFKFDAGGAEAVQAPWSFSSMCFQRSCSCVTDIPLMYYCMLPVKAELGKAMHEQP